MENQRSTEMDILKALAIIAVVVGHSSSPLRPYIYLYHMPLFFFISGYLYKDESTNKPVNFVRKKIKSLYIPFLSFSFVFISLHNIFYSLHLYSDHVGYNTQYVNLYFISDFTSAYYSVLQFKPSEMLLGALWFVPALFYTNILFLIVNLVNKNLKTNSETNRLLIVTIVFIVGNLVPINFPLCPYLNISMVSLSVFYLGFIYKKYQTYVKFNLQLVIIAFGFILLNSSYGTLEMVNQSYVNPPFFLISSLVGIYLNLFFAKKITEMKLNINQLQFIGQNTFTVMALQFTAFKIVNYTQIQIYHLPIDVLAKFPIIDGSGIWWVIYSLCGILIPVGISYIIKSISIKTFIDRFFNYL
jgi:fucose 4-O-acetylase-like acetyltransferase